jgi:catechol 2,3-dioxygenase-like lactoylglutathione lyase family enzyme
MFEYIHHVAYVVGDMDDAVRIFRDTFELELTDRRGRAEMEDCLL